MSMVNLGVAESGGYVCGLVWYTLEYSAMFSWLALRLTFGKKMEINLTTSVFTVIMYFKYFFYQAYVFRYLTISYQARIQTVG